jgi:hypothetical protein
LNSERTKELLIKYFTKHFGKVIEIESTGGYNPENTGVKEENNKKEPISLGKPLFRSKVYEQTELFGGG